MKHLNQSNSPNIGTGQRLSYYTKNLGIKPRFLAIVAQKNIDKSV
jgi:hypothetical protein